MATSEIHPDYNDPGWRHVQHDTKTLACIDRDHDECALPDMCQCDCHHGSTR